MILGGYLFLLMLFSPFGNALGSTFTPLDTIHLHAVIFLAETVLAAVAVWVLVARIRQLGGTPGKAWKITSVIGVCVALVGYLIVF